MPRVGIVGGRGYVGEELLRQLARHPRFELGCVASQQLAGQPLSAAFPELPFGSLTFIDPGIESLAAQAVDLWILAVPNGQAPALVADLPAVTASGNPVRFIDIGADHRCDPLWQYGLADVLSDSVRTATRVANPGCYATGIQLALWPLRSQLVGTPVAFGVSGYSGAGRTPSPRNDPQRLADNLIPYSLAAHQHQREVERHLGHRVRLLPHVASFFRGISLTIRFRLDRDADLEQLQESYRATFADCPSVHYDAAIPEIAAVRETADCRLGGLTAEPDSRQTWIIVSVLDNLAKGAAAQAVQNANLMFGWDRELGIGSD